MQIAVIIDSRESARDSRRTCLPKVYSTVSCVKFLIFSPPQQIDKRISDPHIEKKCKHFSSNASLSAVVTELSRDNDIIMQVRYRGLQNVENNVLKEGCLSI